jgi:universal stress protein A
VPHNFKTILCPIDFSEQSLQAAEYAVGFARDEGAMLLLAHIIHVPSGELYAPDGHTLTFAQATTRTRARLEEVRHTRLGGYEPCDCVVDVGDPYAQLIALARQRRVDLVVLAVRGEGPVAHLLVGSVADKLIRHAPCPIFIVPRSES